jgi:hypothetical protein
MGLSVVGDTLLFGRIGGLNQFLWAELCGEYLARLLSGDLKNGVDETLVASCYIGTRSQFSALKNAEVTCVRQITVAWRLVSNSLGG